MRSQLQLHSRKKSMFRKAWCCQFRWIARVAPMTGIRDVRSLARSRISRLPTAQDRRVRWIKDRTDEYDASLNTTGPPTDNKVALLRRRDAGCHGQQQQQQQQGHALSEVRGGAVVELANGCWLPVTPMAARRSLVVDCVDSRCPDVRAEDGSVPTSTRPTTVIALASSQRYPSTRPCLTQQ